MIKHIHIKDFDLHQRIKRKEIVCAGNLHLKIYGTLHCKSGKRMKRRNRVFFESTEQAKTFGFRPCGNCMREAYKLWKNGLI